jgi:aconitate hydratase
MAFAGKITFNPMTDAIVGSDGISFKFDAPFSDDLPSKGYLSGDTQNIYQAPPEEGGGTHINVSISDRSTRIQKLSPFAAWDGKYYDRLPILTKVNGKCTTDHISMAGPWLKYRGHLENISNNFLIGSTNTDDKINETINVFTGQVGNIPETARDYNARNASWVVIGDENYGEGSSREHAALEARY